MNDFIQSPNLMETSVGQIVANNFRAAEIFKKYNIDFCCGGKTSLQEVCNKKELDLDSLVHELKAQEKSIDYNQPFYQWNPDYLIYHIINKHHKYVRNSLPIILELSAKVAKVHGDAHPELEQIRLLCIQLASELRDHMQKEEKILFPFIDQLYEASCEERHIHRPCFENISYPIRLMEQEHEEAGQVLSQLRKLSNGFVAPSDACTSYQVLYSKLEEFETDLHIHIHLENNILFPKAKTLSSSY